MANAFGTIAAEGQRKDWYVIESVKDPGGGDQYKRKVKTRTAISEDVAADASYALQQVTSSGTGTNANVIGRPIAGKTGTATNDDGDVRSSWFVGYTPQLSTAVMYTRGDGNQPLNDFLPTFFGGEYPARTWAAIMAAALEGEEILSFPPPVFMDQTAEGHEPLPTFTPEPTEEEEPTEEPVESTPPPSSNGGGSAGGAGGGSGGGAGGGAGNDDEPTPTPTEAPTTGGGDGGGGGAAGGDAGAEQQARPRRGNGPGDEG
jgi:membrane peptidoglycan carboxypeptidase